MTLISQVSGTPYVTGGDSPAGTDCSGLASWVSNVATGRPAFGNRFTTSNEENALLTRGFKHGTQPGALVIGWNGSHTAVTLPDGTSVSSGEGGGVKFGGAGAYQSQFTNHMYLDVPPEALTPPDGDMAPPDGMSQQPVDIAVDLVTPPGAPPPGVLPPVDVPPPGVFPDTPPPAEILPPADVPPAADQGIPGDPGAPVPPPGMAV